MTWTPIPAVFYTPQTVTVTIASPGVFTLNNHGLVAGDQVYLSTTGALPTGLTTGTQYFVISAGLTTNNFELSATAGGSAINTSGTQSGVHSLTAEATSSRFQQFLTTNLAALVPVGSYVYRHKSPGSSGLVDGCWLECNGQALNTTTYSALFTVIGYTYGGSGSSFNAPDAGGRFLPGAGGTGGHADVAALGASDGGAVSTRSARHHHSVSETAHNHTVNNITVASANSSHQHDVTIGTITTLSGGQFPGGSGTGSYISISTANNTGHGHSVSGTLSYSSVSAGVTVTPGGSQPVDSPSYICAGTLFIKAL